MWHGPRNQQIVIPSAARDLLLGLEAYVGAHVNKHYSVYILARRSRNLYAGMTNIMMRRLVEHRENRVAGFTSKYRIHRLVYFETYVDVRVAIRREKEMKSWRRERRVALIEAQNPTWSDLAERWFKNYPRQKQIPPAKNRPAG